MKKTRKASTSSTGAVAGASDSTTHKRVTEAINALSVSIWEIEEGGDELVKLRKDFMKQMKERDRDEILPNPNSAEEISEK